MSHKRGHVSNPPSMPHPIPGSDSEEKSGPSLRETLMGEIGRAAQEKIRRRQRMRAAGKLKDTVGMADRPLRKRKRRRRETREQFIARRKRELRGN